MNCLNCGKETKNPKFCSRSCSASFNNKGRKHSKETKEKISKKLKSIPSKFKGIEKVERFNKICKFCKNKFRTKNKNQKYCSQKCYIDYQQSIKTDYKKYQKDCQFKFNIYEYPDKFNLKLIEKYGWYKPYNKGNNLNGISRDHKISIKWGWENNISSKYISHPANCKLMKHRDNNKKNINCSITFKQLLEDIKNW